MSWAYDCIKWLLFIFNLFFCLCGIAIMVVGVLVHLQLSHYDDIGSNVVFPSVTLIVIGSIIFIIAFFGCCGAIRESHCMTVTFASFLLTILIVQVAIAVYAFVVLKGSDDIDISKAYRDVFNKYWTDENSRSAVDSIQSTLHCCGVDSKNDFGASLPNTNYTLPWSCCSEPKDNSCGRLNQFSEPSVYTEGCKTGIQRFLKYTGTVLGGIALGIAGVELVGIIFALCLANSIKNNDRRNYRV